MRGPAFVATPGSSSIPVAPEPTAHGPTAHPRAVVRAWHPDPLARELYAGMCNGWIRTLNAFGSWPPEPGRV